MTVLEESVRRGAAWRKRTPRAAQGVLELPPSRDPLALLAEQDRTRLPDLVPVRVGRMMQSPFTFYRGSAAVMAADLAVGPRSGAMPICCGDAHVSNFGLFASPERAMLFDLNDFDEAAVAPFEWDVKRLTTSVVLAVREVGGSDDAAREAVLACAKAYRTTLSDLVRGSALARYYFAVSADMVLEATRGRERKVVEKAVRKASRRTSDLLIDKLTTVTDDGGRHIVERPPLVVRVGDAPERSVTMEATARYARTAREDVAVLISKFRVVDVARRVVGVGSVGTRCFLVLLEGPAGEPLFLQVKEAAPSVLETYGGVTQPPLPGQQRRSRRCEGRRVVAYQRVLQAASDPFLGWTSGTLPDETRPADYYFRQFRDMKGSIDLSTLDPGQVARYGALCARLLARGHSQSPAAMEAVGYLGSSDAFDDALGGWSVGYADVAERDHAALQAAVSAGRIPAETGV